MQHILIVEDEPLAAKRLHSLLNDSGVKLNQVDFTDSIESTVAYFSSGNSPDLVFMDIELADGRSFSIFERVAVSCPVVFTTAYDEHALQAFSVNSIDYLLKPINPKELSRAVEKFKRFNSSQNDTTDWSKLKGIMQQISAQPNYRSRILINKGDSLIPVSVNEIAWIYAEDKLNFIRTTFNESFVVNFSLDELQRELDPAHFFRANRSWIVHREAVEKASFSFNGKLKLKLNPQSDSEVLVSRERASAFKTWLGS